LLPILLENQQKKPDFLPKKAFVSQIVAKKGFMISFLLV
jgi:hypothetical protein|tara:strand:+ start:1217 stop:1333 length:117 start_codon:yes stop_codon:yes gene_type:complete